MSKALATGVALLVVVILGVIGGCSSSSPPISVSLSPSSTQAIDQGQTIAITANVANDSSFRGVSWSLSGPGTLSGTIGQSITYQSPTTNLSASQQVTITATSMADSTKSASVQITVNPYLAILFQTLPSGSVNTPYSQTIAFTGGTAPFKWSIYNGGVITGSSVGGSVPNGLTLDPNTGRISGTPTSGGTWFFEATVTDATGAFGFNGFLSIQINPSAPPGNPVPFLNQTLVPIAASPGNSAITLSASGSGFVSGATIDFNGVPLVTTFMDSEHLTASVPAADLAVAKTVPVTIVNPAPGGGRSNIAYFQVGFPETTVNFANAANPSLQVPEPSGLAIADFNEDGKPDLVIAANIKMYVFLGNGDGTFAPVGSPLSVPSPPYDDEPSPYVGPAIAVGDFNNSGHLGFAIGLPGNEAAAILFGNGDGTFTYSTTSANTAGGSTISVTAADFNRDGNLDLVAVNSINGETPVVLLGYGQGAFNSVQQNIEIAGVSSATGDFNGDGTLDLVIDGTNILFGNADGTFTQGPATGASGQYFAVGDFNGDGNLDLAVCDNLKNNVTILLGNGDGTFTPASASPIAIGKQPDAIVSGDFNNDGKLDLAIANYGDNSITLLLGNGDGTFTPTSGSPYTVGHGPCLIAAGDLNNDGKLDLVVVNLTDGTISVLLQQ